MKSHSAVGGGDADYSSTLPGSHFSAEGISHQRDEGCITQKCKVSRLEAAASDWYLHLDCGLDLGFPKLLEVTDSSTSAPGPATSHLLKVSHCASRLPPTRFSQCSEAKGAAGGIVRC